MTSRELQSQIAKDLTAAFSDKLGKKASTDTSKSNQDFADDVCAFYEKVFDVVKRKMEE